MKKFIMLSILTSIIVLLYIIAPAVLVFFGLVFLFAKAIW
jgi:hypothetical protein